MTDNSTNLHLPGPSKDKRIVVAMSGGVDSSVVAALLKERGYDVVGITLQLYDHGEATGRKGTCCAGQDIHDARRVAAALDIPHYVLDYEDRFADSVMDAFADSYLAGETPVPCVACNQQIKFNDLFRAAQDLGASALATGHYIASRPGPYGWELHAAADADRDQSYFLFATTREQLGFLRFPLGDMVKSEVRAHAERHGLVVADKPDSQDICFVPTGRYTDVIERLRPDAVEPGEIVHADGRVLGRHDGIINFTIGQRRGIGIATGEPLFVLRLDAGRRRVIVGPREQLRTHRLSLRNVNWLGDVPLEELCSAAPHTIRARIRSSQRPQPAEIECGASGIEVSFPEGEYGVSPGQACVFYGEPGDDGRARVLGGGWIAATSQSKPPAREGAPVADSVNA